MVPREEQRWRKLTWSNLEYKIFRIMADTFRSSWTRTDPARNKIKNTRNALSYRQKQPFHRPYHISLHHHHHQQEPQQGKPATEREEKKKREKTGKKRRYTDATKWKKRNDKMAKRMLTRVRSRRRRRRRIGPRTTTLSRSSSDSSSGSSSTLLRLSSRPSLAPPRPSVRPFVLFGRT